MILIIKIIIWSAQISFTANSGSFLTSIYLITKHKFLYKIFFKYVFFIASETTRSNEQIGIQIPNQKINIKDYVFFFMILSSL